MQQFEENLLAFFCDADFPLLYAKNKLSKLITH